MQTNPYCILAACGKEPPSAYSDDTGGVEKASPPTPSISPIQLQPGNTAFLVPATTPVSAEASLALYQRQLAVLQQFHHLVPVNTSLPSMISPSAFLPG